MRMSLPALQLATLARDANAKLVGMDEIVNGGTTSVGAQLRKFQTPCEPVDMLTPSGKRERRAFTIHAPYAIGDFPQMAAMLAVKGSTSAYRYDRLSTLDQRSEHYGKPNSLLRPNTPGVPSNFKRVTHEDVTKVLKRAAAEPSAKKREAMLTDIGRNASAYEFDGDGSYVEDFALADNRIPLLNNIDGCPHDHMHTSMSSGTVSHEGYLQQYNNICIEKYYTLNELNAEVKSAHLPPGVYIPEFGKYCEKGIKGNLPKPHYRLKFSASQNRHWLEHGTTIMEGIFERKKITSYKNRPSWLSWLALVRVETSALAQSFAYPESLIRLDDLQLAHHEAFLKVPSYKNTIKPKALWRSNYPVDIDNCGPSIRTHCLTFEATLQLLKRFAANCNYKNHLERSVIHRSAAPVLHAHTHARIHTRTHTHTHTHIHAPTPTHTPHAHTARTHAHTHAPPSPSPPPSPPPSLYSCALLGH